MGGIDLFVCAQDTGVFFSVFLSVPGWKKGGRHTWQGVLRGRSPPPVRACGLQRRCGLCANPLEETALAAPVEYCGGRGGGKCSSMLGFYERCGHRQWASLPPIGGEPHAQTFHRKFLVLHVVPSHAPPPLSLPPYPLRILPSAMGRKHRPRPSSAHKSARRAENVATDQRGECRGKGAAQVVSKKKKNATPGRARSAARTTAHRRWNEG